MNSADTTKASDGSLTEATDARMNSAFNAVGEGLAQLGGQLQSTDPRDVADDLSAYARKNPVAFLAGAALLGFAAMRLAPEAARHLENEGGLDALKSGGTGYE